MTERGSTDNPFAARYVDLLNEKLGGKALCCSDEWFAECANLVKDAAPVFREGHFVPTGQWMDGWESRRSFGRGYRENGPDHDWCLLKLGIPGRVRGVNVDTSHFRGNAPEYAAIEAANVAGEVDENTEWVEILPKSGTAPHSPNLFPVDSDGEWTHLRLKIYPDGGVARLRVYGEARARRENFIEGELLDLASIVNGGRGLACSDMFYSSPGNLLMPAKGVNMGDGWETRRRRDDRNDWCIVKLGLVGSIRKVLVDTAHFKGNYPDTFSLEGVNTAREDITADDIPWQTVIPRSRLYPDQEHLFIKQIDVPVDAEFSHVRMNIFPDGGVSRLRVYGFPDWGK
ncbi:MAG: allantoicase [Haliea sp.]|uniref:allantoicase n=1 Tax=Marinobacter salarius TaxID=1420917 RepID=UPI0032EC0F9F